MPQLEAPEKLAAKINKTPGFTCTANHRSKGGFWAVNIERKKAGETVACATSIGTHFNSDQSFQNTLTRLRRIGWTYELYQQSKTAARDARINAARAADPGVAAALFAGTAFEDRPDSALAQVLQEVPRQRPGDVHPDDYGVRAMTKADEVSIYSLAAFDQCEARPQLVDRKTALEWTERLPAYQRKRSPMTEKRYGRMMLRGEWAAILNGILLDPDGLPLDGQTRLFALIWATDPENLEGNITLKVPFMVWHNVPRAMFRYIDRQRRRTVANTLQGLGEKNANQLGAAVKLLYLYDKLPQSEWSHAYVSEDQQVAHLDANGDIRQSMYWGKLHERGFNKTAAIVAHHLLTRHYTDPVQQRYIDSWFARLHHGYNLTVGDPSAALRDYLMTADTVEYNRIDVGKRVGPFHLYLLLKTWGNTLEGNEILRVSPRRDFAVPRDLPSFPVMPENARFLPTLPKSSQAGEAA
ncbi:hypothetical protein AB0J38_14620 [Streptomyces sp. NPDC050095]|uniref:hypothetical protein n=1 Tax=unclassified Streptomyces TaxID=2593676 RepID=UPI00343D714F